MDSLTPPKTVTRVTYPTVTQPISSMRKLNFARFGSICSCCTRSLFLAPSSTGTTEFAFAFDVTGKKSIYVISFAPVAGSGNQSEDRKCSADSCRW